MNETDEGNAAMAVSVISKMFHRELKIRTTDEDYLNGIAKAVDAIGSDELISLYASSPTAERLNMKAMELFDTIIDFDPDADEQHFDKSSKLFVECMDRAFDTDMTSHVKSCVFIDRLDELVSIGELVRERDHACNSYSLKSPETTH